MRNRSCLLGSRGQGQSIGAAAPRHPAGGAHETYTVHHTTPEPSRSFEEIMTKSNIVNLFMKFEVKS
jgi:hypothetical protein